MNHTSSKLLFALSLLFVHCSIFSQDKLSIKFGQVDLEDFNVKSKLIDSSTSAVVVADVGNSEFIANTTQFTFSLIFIEKKRIKIINKNGFDAASIIVPLYVNNSGKAETLVDLNAYTYNVENGTVVETKLDKSSVLTEKYNKNWIHKKFTFPSLKEGSIIEYSYQIKSDFFYNLHPWVFQETYPVLWSQYNASIPEFYKFIILSQGYQPFLINKVDKSGTSFSFVEHEKNTLGEGAFNDQVTSTSINTFRVEGNIDNHTWVMKDVPALKEEPFTTTIRNSIAKIEFQLNQVAYPRSIPQNYMNSWEKVSEELMKDESFGIPINKANNWLDDELSIIIRTTTDVEEKAKKIFEHVRDHYTCNNKKGIYTLEGLKEVVKNKTGSIADINMLLIAMLRNQKINVNPVILSTRNHGLTHEFYPLMDRYNYVIAQVSIAGKLIYLDATEPRLAFGKLPLKLYNGQARIITTTAMPVYFIADSLKEDSNEMAIFINNDNGIMEGSFSSQSGYYHSLEIRNELAKTNMDEYKKSLLASAAEEMGISNISIDSVQLLDKPVNIKYDITLKSFGDANIVYFNPMVGKKIKKNPFAAADRFYPVEMPYTVDDIYTFSMDIPKGYKMDEMPKSARVMLNENEGMFEYIISVSEDNIQMRRRLLIKKATYTNEDYQTLRNFYEFMVSKEAEQIVFKKIK